MTKLVEMPTRPYRVEVDYSGKFNCTATFASEDAARRYIAGCTTGWNPIKNGRRWRIVKKLNKSGTQRELVGEGVGRVAE